MTSPAGGGAVGRGGCSSGYGSLYNISLAASGFPGYRLLATGYRPLATGSKGTEGTEGSEVAEVSHSWCKSPAYNLPRRGGGAEGGGGCSSGYGSL